MAERGFSARQDEPLIGVVTGDADNQVVFYFAHEQEVVELSPADGSRLALALAGAWSDLDWEQMAQELDHIRHDNPPFCGRANLSQPRRPRVRITVRSTSAIRSAGSMPHRSIRPNLSNARNW